jgi:hypothetical protein
LKVVKKFRTLLNGLQDVVVVTTCWDEVYHDEEALQEAEWNEESLMESERLLKELRDAGARFIRSGYFQDGFPHGSDEGMYLSPATIMGWLLGLERSHLEIDSGEKIIEDKPIQEIVPGLVIEKESQCPEFPTQREEYQVR